MDFENLKQLLINAWNELYEAEQAEEIRKKIYTRQSGI